MPPEVTNPTCTQGQWSVGALHGRLEGDLAQARGPARITLSGGKLSNKGLYLGSGNKLPAREPAHRRQTTVSEPWWLGGPPNNWQWTKLAIHLGRK